MVELEQFGDYEFEGLPRSEANLRWLAEHMACTECGECCRRHNEGVRITHADAERLARHDGLAREEFLKTVHEEREDYVMSQPCRYLQGNRCAIHVLKPDVCRSYPLHHASVQGVPTRWVVVTACPAGKKLIELILSGPQEGLEYAQ
jgi:hypothetical protein